MRLADGIEPSRGELLSLPPVLDTTAGQLVDLRVQPKLTQVSPLNDLEFYSQVTPQNYDLAAQFL